MNRMSSIFSPGERGPNAKPAWTESECFVCGIGEPERRATATPGHCLRTHDLKNGRNRIVLTLQWVYKRV